MNVCNSHPCQGQAAPVGDIGTLGFRALDLFCLTFHLSFAPVTSLPFYALVSCLGGTSASACLLSVAGTALCLPTAFLTVPMRWDTSVSGATGFFFTTNVSRPQVCWTVSWKLISGWRGQEKANADSFGCMFVCCWLLLTGYPSELLHARMRVCTCKCEACMSK